MPSSLALDSSAQGGHSALTILTTIHYVGSAADHYSNRALVHHESETNMSGTIAVLGTAMQRNA